MKDEQFEKLKEILDKEIIEYKNKIISKPSEYLYDNAREIYATKFIYDYLTDKEIMEDVDFHIFPKRNILKLLTSFYLESHGEIRDDDIADMLYDGYGELKKFCSIIDGSEM